jgi:hypothetical protein
MNSVERLELAIAEARKRGLEVRLEALQGTSGGLCEFGRKRWIFVDLTAPVLEQLEQVLSALRQVSARETLSSHAS